MRLRPAFAVLLVALVSVTAETRRAQVFLDDFEYAVGRETTDKDTPFAAAGWNGGTKSRPEDTGARGYLYTGTTSDVPGACGNTFPGTSSTRVLIAEALAATYSGQTDFYIQFGTPSTPNLIPADVWIQFWLCPIYAGTMLSEFGPQSKLLYVSTDGTYPSSDHKWLISAGSQVQNPIWGEPFGRPTSNHGMYVNFSGVTAFNFPDYSPADPGDEGQLGLLDADYIALPNQWTLIKMRLVSAFTSGTGGNRWEMWARTYGTPTWTKWAEWVADGSTTANFTWAITSGHEGGHATMKLFTTWETYDAYVAMDDFVIAESENDLPTYQDTSGSSGTIRLRIRGEM